MTTWTTFTLRVDTPLFSGDLENDDAASIVRVPSIRGALRFWYRAVAARYGIRDLIHLAASEAEIFGNTHHRSPIRMRISRFPSSTTRKRMMPRWATHAHNGFSGPQYLLGQGLWKHKAGLERPCLPVDAEFELAVRFDDNDDTTNRFLAALWAWLTYGGLGARVRRGFGRLSLLDTDGLPDGCRVPLPYPTDDVDQQEQRWREVLPPEAKVHFTTHGTEAPPGRGLAPFPSLADWDFSASHTTASLEQTLQDLGLSWRHFRNAAEATTTATPEWENVVRGDEDDYPVAALGLPVNYFELKTRKTATVDLEVDGAPARRASPVWLTPVRIGDTYAAFTHVFFAELLPTGSTLRLVGDFGTRPLTPPTPDMLRATWEAWLDGARRPLTDRPPR